MGYHRRMRQTARKRMSTACTDVDLEALMSAVESNLVECRAAIDGDAPRAVRQVGAHHVRCTVRVRPDWPGNAPASPG